MTKPRLIIKYNPAFPHGNNTFMEVLSGSIFVFGICPIRQYGNYYVFWSGGVYILQKISNLYDPKTD